MHYEGMNPLAFIKTCVQKNRIFWTYHVNMRFRERSIKREEILSSVESYEIIESYPHDKYFPSYLVYTEFQGKSIHILFAVDEENENVRVITVYHPSTNKWLDDLKTRRQQ